MNLLSNNIISYSTKSDEHEKSDTYKEQSKEEYKFSMSDSSYDSEEHERINICKVCY